MLKVGIRLTLGTHAYCAQHGLSECPESSSFCEAPFCPRAEVGPNDHAGSSPTHK